MISILEIKEKAVHDGVPISTIERDYAQDYLLSALVKINMALKGGTAIRKLYIENYRFSDDLDFTMCENIEASTLKRKIRKAVFEARKESGINFSNRVKFEESKSGIRATVSFSVVHRSNNMPITIKIDITFAPREKILLGTVKRKLIHSYSDRLSVFIESYTLMEILSEKLRALFERTRPRDLYDIYYFRRYLYKEGFNRLFNEKCRLKDVVPNIQSVKERKLNFKNAWENSLHNQFKSLPEFEEAYVGVINAMEKIL